METKYQTSFIPKSPVVSVGSRRSGGMGLFLVLSIVVFLISLGLAGYVFLEKSLLIKKIQADQSTIEANKNGLISDSVTIESLVELNSRINVANELLDKHVAVSPIFNFLQQRTLKSVRFKNFNFSSTGRSETDTNKISVQMAGVARDWETVASQADEFGRPEWKKIITEPKVSDLSLDADGRVSFLFSAYISPDSLFYENSMKN